MRYSFWDVLLFPEGSTVPIQEFQTRCHVAETPDGGKLPTLVCFIPSLRQGAPFTISIHAWQRPAPLRVQSSQVALGVSTELPTFAFEVMSDGHHVSTACFGPNALWPQQINRSHFSDAEGDFEPLRFPAFHTDILRQAHYNISETFGRIRVTLTERLDTFEGTTTACKELVCFSFHHAPLNLLEQAGVAWPNCSMWKNGFDDGNRTSNTTRMAPAYHATHDMQGKIVQPADLSDPFGSDDNFHWHSTMATGFTGHTLPSGASSLNDTAFHRQTDGYHHHSARQVPVMLSLPENKMGHFLGSFNGSEQTARYVSDHGFEQVATAGDPQTFDSTMYSHQRRDSGPAMLSDDLPFLLKTPERSSQISGRQTTNQQSHAVNSLAGQPTSTPMRSGGPSVRLASGGKAKVSPKTADPNTPVTDSPQGGDKRKHGVLQKSNSEKNANSGSPPAKTAKTGARKSTRATRSAANN